MKILHINCNYTGTSLHQTMVEKLNALGIKNNVFVPVHTKLIPPSNMAKYVKISACFHKWDWVSFKNKQRKIYNSLLKCYNPANFDILHAYTLFTDGNCAYSLSKKYHLPYIVTVRNTDLNSFFRLRPDLRNQGIEIMKHAAAICFLSPAYKKQLFLKYIPRKLWKELLQKVYIIPNGINDFWHCNKYMQRNYPAIINRFKQKNLSVIYAGVIDKNKNLLTTCLALDTLEKKGWNIKYTVIGKILDPTVAQQVINRSYARLLKPLPMEKLMNVLREHDIFIMLSRTESFGLVYAEAMSQGLPILYSKGQGFDGQFKNGYCGYAVPATDVEKLEEKILRILNDYQILSQHALQGIDKFKWEKLCSLYCNIYKQTLEQRNL